MIQLALFGQPVRHSLSPAIHRAFGRQAGIGLEYRAIDTAPGTLASALTQFAGEGGTGCNITMPLKAEAAGLAKEQTERVRLSGAANTLSLNGDGTWSADSTDGPGLLRDLLRLHIDPAGLDIALLGAGGAAASVLATLLERRPASLTLFNRSLDRARSLAGSHASLSPVSAQPLAALASAPAVDLLINATSLGHGGALPPLDPERFRAGGHCYDMNYGPAAAPLQRWCAAAGIDYADGLGMLVAQAAESFTRWTGFTPEIDPVLAQLRD